MLKQLKKGTLLLTLGSVALFSSGLAQADGDGFMLGVGGYYSLIDDKFDIDDIDDLEKINFDDSSFAYNLAAGWRFNKMFAVDAGYWDLGDYKSDSIENQRKRSVDTEAFTLGGMISIPLWILDVYARGGVAWWDADGRSIDDDGTDPYYGLGASLNLGGSLDIYAEWVRFDLETDLDTVGMGVRWTF